MMLTIAVMWYIGRRKIQDRTKKEGDNIKTGTPQHLKSYYILPGYKKCYNMAAFIPMKAAISLIFIIFAAEYNKKAYDGIYNR